MKGNTIRSWLRAYAWSLSLYLSAYLHISRQSIQKVLRTKAMSIYLVSQQQAWCPALGTNKVLVGPERGREGGSLLLGKMGQGFIERLTFPVGLQWMVGTFTEKQA